MRLAMGALVISAMLVFTANAAPRHPPVERGATIVCPHVRPGEPVRCHKAAPPKRAVKPVARKPAAPKRLAPHEMMRPDMPR